MKMKLKNHLLQFEVQDAVQPEIFKVIMSPNPQIMNPSLPLFLGNPFKTCSFNKDNIEFIFV